MKVIELYNRIKQDESLQFRNLKVRFSIICFFLLMAFVFLPILGLRNALVPITIVCLIGLTSSFLHVTYEIRGKKPHSILYLTVFIDILFITIAIHYLGGIQTPFAWVYTIVLIAISLVRGLRIGIYAAVLSSLMNAALMIGEFSGIIPLISYRPILNPVYLHQDKFYLYMRLLGDTILFLLTASVSGIISEKLTQRRQVVERKNTSILRMQQRLQDYANELEDAIAERTEELTTTNELLRREISKHQHAQEELDKSVSLLGATLESTADGILVVDNEGKITSFNRKFLELWRIPPSVMESRDDDQALAFVLSQLKDPEAFIAKVRELYDHPEEESFDVLQFKDGRVFERYSQPQKVGGSGVGRVWSFRDITEERQLEQQLLQAQKMESIGTLAGGIAHDFNNLLGGILGYTSLAKIKIPKDEQTYKYIDTIERSARRAAELTSQLLAFARGGRYDTKPLDINNIVHATMGIISRTFDKSIEIETNLCTHLPWIEADAGQMQQVLMNLCVNAGDAMPQGGKLIIETGVEDSAKNYVEALAGKANGPYVSLTVTDTGMGMDRKTEKRIFEPFFTTKEEGKGTGLGLSMVYGVVKNHGGFVRVESAPDRGTTFKVYLPGNGKAQIEASHRMESHTSKAS